MKIQVHKGRCLDYKGEVIILFHFNDIRPLCGNPGLLDWRCNASVSMLWKRKKDLFKYGQLTIVATQGKIPSGTVILTGLGAGDSLDDDLRREACRLALKAAIKVGGRNIAVDGSLGGPEEGQVTAEDIRSVLGNIDEGDISRISLFPGNGRQQSTTRGKDKSPDGAA